MSLVIAIDTRNKMKSHILHLTDYACSWKGRPLLYRRRPPRNVRKTCSHFFPVHYSPLPPPSIHGMKVRNQEECSNCVHEVSYVTLWKLLLIISSAGTTKNRPAFETQTSCSQFWLLQCWVKNLGKIAVCAEFYHIKC